MWLECCSVSNVCDRQEVGAYELGTINERGDWFVDFCKQYDIVIENTYQNINCRKRYTWKISGGIRIRRY